MAAVQQGRLPTDLIDWAAQVGFPRETITELETACIPPDAAPFFQWMASKVQKPYVGPTGDRVRDAECERERIERKIAEVRRRLGGLMGRSAQECLSDEMADLKMFIFNVSRIDFEERKVRSKGAVQHLLRQEAQLTSQICEMEESSADDRSPDILSGTIEIEDKLAAYEKVYKLHQAVEAISLSVNVVAAKATAVSEFRDSLKLRLGDVTAFTQDTRSDAAVIENELFRLHKKLAELEKDRLKYELLRQRLYLTRTAGLDVASSLSAKQAKAVDAMLQQERRYKRAIDIIKCELKSTMTAELKYMQCCAIIDKSI